MGGRRQDMKTFLKIAAVAALAVAGSAQASVIVVGNFSLDGFGATTGAIGGASATPVTSVTLSADALQAAGFAFQADVMMRITGPGGLDVTYGPNDNTPPGNIDWPTIDPGAPQLSGDAQVVFINLPIAGAAGAYTVEFTNGFSFNAPGDTVNWNNVVVELVPTPGAFALLGMGGLLAARRRR